jgi:hypothetical protein
MTFIVYCLDPATNRLCPERLPPTTIPAVVQFYQALADGAIDDIFTIPTQNARKKSVGNDKKSVPTDTASGKSVNSSVDNRDGSGNSDNCGSETGVKQYWEATTAGQAWFDLCSALPGVGYLSSVKPDGGSEVHYELQPNIANVCATLGVLLGLKRETDTAVGRPWSMKDIEECWNNHVRGQAQSHSAVGGGEAAREIVTTQGVVRFRAPFSDTEMIARDVGSVAFVGGRHSLDIELESAHQLATVKHRLGNGGSEGGGAEGTASVWNTAMVEQLRIRYEGDVRRLLSDTAQVIGIGSGVTAPASVAQLVCTALQSTVLGDQKLTTLLALLRDNSLNYSPSPRVDALILDALLTARWGEERRTGAILAHSAIGGDNTGAVLSVTDASLTSADANIRAQESVQMTLQALRLIAHCRDARLAAQLVRWVLQEAPTEINVAEIASALMSIEPSIRNQTAFQQELKELYSPDATLENSSAARVLGFVLRFGADEVNMKSVFATLFETGRGLTLRDKLLLCRLYLQHSFRR